MTNEPTLTESEIYDLADSAEANPDDRGWGPKFDLLAFARLLERRIHVGAVPDLMKSHGHVRPHPAGIKARCGGPAMCKVCQQEQAALSVASPTP